MTGRRHLVYTSAGDRSLLELWLEGRRNFDLWVTYYGDGDDRHRPHADFWQKRAGAKFPNLHALWLEHREHFARYDAVLVMDDDIVIDGDGLSRLFELRAQYDLTILQPAFLPSGKVSHKVTRHRSDHALRFAEFVEMTCPLFERRALEAFLEAYDGRLTGFGVDYWFLDVLRRRTPFRAAIIDEVPCINPSDTAKGGVREIGRIGSDAARRAEWERVRARHRIVEPDRRASRGGIPSSLSRRLLGARRSILRRHRQALRFRRHLDPRRDTR